MPLNDRDYDLLSLYINDALTPDEQRDVESRLASDAEMREELAALRQTVSLINGMPEMVALRDLRLSPAMVADTLAGYAEPRPVVRTRVSAMRILTNFAAAAASFVLVMAGVFTLTQPGQPPAMTSYPQVALSNAQIEATAALDEAPAAFMAIEPALTRDMEAAEMSTAEDATLLQMTAPMAESSAEAFESAAGILLDTADAPLMTPDAMARHSVPAGENPVGNSAGGGSGPDELPSIAAAEVVGEITDAAHADSVLRTRDETSDMPSVSPLIGLLLIAAGLTLGATTLLIRSRP